MHEELIETTNMKDNRYEVRLPWRSSFPLLQDNYQLSQARLSNLVKRLRQDPDILKEYDAVIRDQIEKGIGEEVNDTSETDLG